MTLILLWGLAMPAAAAEAAVGSTLRLEKTEGTVTVKNASGKSLNSTRYWPVTVGCPEMTVKPQPGKSRTPVSMSARNLYNAPVRFYAGPSEGNLNLGTAFMIQGGKLSYKINQQ